MKKILLVLVFCVLIPVTGYSKDLWKDGDELVFETDNYILRYTKDGSQYKVRVMFDVNCNQNDKKMTLSKRLGIIRGIGHLENNNMIVTTQDGSRLTLSLKSIGKGPDDIEMTVIPEISSNQKITWDTNKFTDNYQGYKVIFNDPNQCKKEVDKINKTFRNFITKTKINGWVGD